MTKIELSNNTKIIRDSAFYKCDKLYDINFPESIRVIGKYAFSQCATLPELKLQNIKYIGGSAFEKCYNLKNVEIYGDINQLYAYTFDACLNLADIKLTDNIIYISKDVCRHSKMLNTEELFYGREKTQQFHPKDADVTNMHELEIQILNEE